MASGHGAAAFRYTPRQALALSHFAARRKARELAHSLSLGALAAQGGEDAINDTIAGLQRIADDED